MPNKHATMQRGGPMGHSGAQHADATGRGRSESSPGHLKKAAGAQSAHDFAPGNLRHADRVTVPPETTSDETRDDRED